MEKGGLKEHSALSLGLHRVPECYLKCFLLSFPLLSFSIHFLKAVRVLTPSLPMALLANIVVLTLPAVEANVSDRVDIADIALIVVEEVVFLLYFVVRTFLNDEVAGAGQTALSRDPSQFMGKTDMVE